MATDTKQNKHRWLYWLFKALGVLVACLLPVWAICEKFPIWRVKYGTDHSVGVGAILIAIVIVIIARKAIFQFFAERLKLKHAPPVIIWIVLLIVAYTFIFIAKFLMDLTTVLWMGLIGCVIGSVLTFIGENFFGKKVVNDDGNGN